MTLLKDRCDYRLFPMSGITVSFSNFLNSKYNGYTINSCVSINNIDARPSGPMALSGLSLERTFWTDSTSHCKSQNDTALVETLMVLV